MMMEITFIFSRCFSFREKSPTIPLTNVLTALLLLLLSSKSPTTTITSFFGSLTLDGPLFVHGALYPVPLPGSLIQQGQALPFVPVRYM